MPQHDYIIDNQSGASFRADLNSMAAAVVSQNSGASEPATKYAYMPWADTTAGLLKVRNAANTNWIEVGKISTILLGHVYKDDLQKWTHLFTAAGGSVDALTATLASDLTALTDGMTVLVEAAGANATTTPTLNLTLGSTATGAKTIVKGANAALEVADIVGAGHRLILTYKSAWDKWELINPAKGVTASGGTAAPTGTIAQYAGVGAPTGWLLCAGQAVSRSTYATLFAALVLSNTVTMTIASPCVVSLNGHPYIEGDPIKFTTTGALPTGLTAGTTYYVKAPATNTFNVSATPGGTAINTSGTQSGTHTAIHAPYGDGDGSTTFNVPDLKGRTAIGADNMGGTAANRMTSGGSGIYGIQRGGSGGSETHTLTIAQTPTHTHSYNDPNGSGAGVAATNNTGGGVVSQTGSSGSGNAHNNTQPSLVLNYIIKT